MNIRRIRIQTNFSRTMHAVVALSLLLVFQAVPAAAATTQIVGGTNGAACNSGGYFTPSSVTINSGDTITISVPANDPYAGGMEVLGFPQGNFDIARGGSFTTDAITANVSYHGTWPNDPGCPKGSGTITVNAPVTPPPPSGGSSGSTSGSSGGGSTQSTPSTSSSSKSSASSTTSTGTSTQPAASAPTTSTATTTPKSASESQPTVRPTPKVAVTTTKSSGLKNVATIGGGGLAVVAIGLFLAWYFLFRHRLGKPAEQPVRTTEALVQADPTPPVVAEPTMPAAPQDTAETSAEQGAAPTQNEEVK